MEKSNYQLSIYQSPQTKITAVTQRLLLCNPGPAQFHLLIIQFTQIFLRM